MPDAVMQSASLEARKVPLSLGQERLFRLARLNPGEPLYNVTAAYLLAGALDLDGLARAVHQIEQRHETLRATFAQQGDAAVCTIRSISDPAVFEHSDLRAMPADGREAALQRLLEVEARQIFDLAEGPLWRVHVVTLEGDMHALALTMHHIVTDGWSFGVFLKELGELYAAASEGRAAALPELESSYVDFADRQRQLVASDACARQRLYWEERFAAPAQALRLPGMAQGGMTADRRCAVYPLDVPEDLSRAIVDFSQQERATPFITLLAAFSSLLNRASGQADLLVATPVTGRHFSQTRHLIGYFNNIVPLRFDLAAAVSLGDVLAVVRENALAAYRNQDVPFQTVGALPGLRGVSPSRLLFSFDMAWPPDFSLGDIRCASIPLDTGVADFDLGLSLWMRDGRIAGSLRYKTALFETEAVEALAATYLGAIETLAGDPGTAIAALPLDAGLVVPVERSPVEPAGMDHSRLPRDPFELRVAREWEAAFASSPIGVDEELASLGATSLAVAELTERLHRAFGVDIPLGAVFQASSIRKMAALLRSSEANWAESPIAPIRSEGSRPPLFLCEGVGIYYPLAARLGEDQPVYALYSEVGEDYAGVRDLAARYLDAVLEIQPEGPYQIGGISFGGLVAFEMARQLRERGREVALLALFDTPGPGAYRRKGRVGKIVGHLRNLVRFGLPYVRRILGARRARPAGEGGHEAGASPPLVGNQEQVRALFQDKADVYAVEPYPGRITLFMLRHRSGMTDSLFDPALGHVDPYLGWGAVAAEGVERHFLEGEHVTILQEPYVEHLAGLLTKSLA